MYSIVWTYNLVCASRGLGAGSFPAPDFLALKGLIRKNPSISDTIRSSGLNAVGMHIYGGAGFKW